MESQPKLPRTMREISAAVGLDRSTVSVIANGNPRGRKFAPETIERVLTYLREIGYTPPKGVLQIRGELPARLGILQSGKLYSHLTQAFNMLLESQTGNSHGAEVVALPQNSAASGLREMVARGVERPVWIVPNPIQLGQSDHAEILAFGKRLRPIIYNHQFGNRSETDLLLENGFSLVGLDRADAYGKMARLLVKLGHRSVLVGDVASPKAVAKIERVFLVAMEKAGLELKFPRPANSINMPLAPCGAAIMKRALPRFKRGEFTAVCFRDDELAAGALQTLVDEGIRVPEDVTVVGMDGHPLSHYFRVALTTLAIPVDRMVERTLALCAEEGDTPSENLFRFRLVRGASHGPPSKKTRSAKQDP